MTKAYSDDLRQRCGDAMACGDAASKVALRFGVSKSSVIKWYQRYKTTGSVSPSAMGGKRSSFLEAHRDFILDQIQHTSHLSVRQFADILKDKGIHVSHNAVWLFLRREGLSFKKTLLAIEQGRADVVRRRKCWKRIIASRLSGFMCLRPL